MDDLRMNEGYRSDMIAKGRSRKIDWDFSTAPHLKYARMLFMRMRWSVGCLCRGETAPGICIVPTLCE